MLGARYIGLGRDLLHFGSFHVATYQQISRYRYTQLKTGKASGLPQISHSMFALIYRTQSHLELQVILSIIRTHPINHTVIDDEVSQAPAASNIQLAGIEQRRFKMGERGYSALP
jgi:hypothetical protein